LEDKGFSMVILEKNKEKIPRKVITSKVKKVNGK
jgi:hypothetical protein